MKTLESKSLPETKQIAKNWLVSISNTYANQSGALVVGLSGHLGAGKTAFTKCVAQILGIEEDITSPTFVIMKLYLIGGKVKNEATHVEVPWKKLVHIDAYRLEDKEQLQVLEWDKLIADRDNLILIEWPENVGLTEFSPSAFLKFEAKEGNHSISIS
ncbi:MAG TPA: tRNA (adenosine(37)-N6)-threonylcarbamoyltransferase complex ATPase subunit type 1 TsaE [Candidatus Paceibacterota bacterium]|jgi:tRNA threonylcarbamoyladenosine biosynthesis protein TsaE|nr:tRNA (adenosine(37)-N6)-threonylcarbamoyltransferase complex ATPase subunit type 1 TsaE [Candidatus Paceibacterota bacterium]